MNQEMIYTLLLGIGFILLFVVSELLYHKANVKPENTRKFVHVSGGLISLLFPQLLHNHWYVLLLCSLFIVILYVTKQFGLLPSINRVNRVTRGSLLFPLAVYMCYLAFDFSGHDFKFFYIPFNNAIFI